MRKIFISCRNFRKSSRFPDNGVGVVISFLSLPMWLSMSVSVGCFCFRTGFQCSRFLRGSTFRVVQKSGKSAVGVFLGLEGSLTGSRAPSRSRWGSGMDSIFLLRQTPVRWVSVLERNTSCSFFWCRSGYFTAYDDSFVSSFGSIRYSKH